MGALGDAPWRLLVLDFITFVALGGGTVVIPLALVKHCQSDDDACAAKAAQRLVQYGLAGSLPQLLAAPLVGRACDRLGPKIPLLAGCIGVVASLILAALWALYGWPFYALLFSAAANGVCGGTLGFLAASFAYAAASAKAPEETYAPLAGEEEEDAPEQRTGGFRGVAVALTLSICVSPAAGGAAAQHVGAFATLAGAAGVAIIALLWTLFALPAVAPTKSEAKADVLRGLKVVAAPPTRWLAFAWTLVATNNIGVGNIATQYLARDRSSTGVGLYISLLGAAAAVGTLVIEPLVRKVWTGDEFRLNLLLARAGCLVAAGISVGFALLPASNPGIYGIACLASVTAASMPASRALLVASAPKEDGGAALGALGALESASGLVAPVWLGYLYAYGARHSRAADAFYGTVATAALAFVVLMVRPPEPRHEYLRRISLPAVTAVSESDGEGTLV